VTNSPISQPSPCYSLKWAASVVLHFEEKHTRAFAFTLAVFCISPGQLAQFIARGDPFWLEFKKCAKVWESQWKYGLNVRTADEARRDYLNALECIHSTKLLHERLKSYLTSLKNSSN